MKNRPLTGPTRVDAVMQQLHAVFPMLDPYTVLGDVALDEWQRITSDNVEAIGHIFWHMSQTMLLRDAVALYRGLSQQHSNTWAQYWLLGKHTMGLGAAVLCAVWTAERRERQQR